MYCFLWAFFFFSDTFDSYKTFDSLMYSSDSNTMLNLVKVASSFCVWYPEVLLHKCSRDVQNKTQKNLSPPKISISSGGIFIAIQQVGKP